MKKYKNIAVVCVLFLAVAIGAYCMGYKTAYDSVQRAKAQNEEQTFYAAVTGIDASNFEVQGLPVNEINYCGAFTFAVTAETKLEWRGTELSLSDFDVGDSISITFSGDIQETDPAHITDVVRIQLLDDEK